MSELEEGLLCLSADLVPDSELRCASEDDVVALRSSGQYQPGMLLDAAREAIVNQQKGGPMVIKGKEEVLG